MCAAAATANVCVWLVLPPPPCKQVTGSLLDDDTHYSRCDPLTLTSANATSWEFKGVRAAIK